jgi:hypothetical protein
MFSTFHYPLLQGMVKDRPKHCFFWYVFHENEDTFARGKWQIPVSDQIIKKPSSLLGNVYTSAKGMYVDKGEIASLEKNCLVGNVCHVYYALIAYEMVGMHLRRKLMDWGLELNYFMKERITWINKQSLAFKHLKWQSSFRLV